ncbi:sensor histidine kinase [Halorientalis pallida]|uniref:histidine kinase n=1 Tax=Halorientalis pallida TaxID=2479928 RepID=A0A498KSH5_9EURY|nr:histidine kinase N-terminal 7TM domain-containing protein [Halorientalis pallida]RXK46175.1 PAS domain-containing protein [Halorientalis pallida]
MLQFSWLLLVLVFPLLVAVPTILVIVRNFENPRLSPIPPLVLIVAVSLWCLADAARLAVTGLDAKLALYPGYYLMGTVVVVSLFVFAADYTERSAWLRPSQLGLVTAPLLVSTGLEVANFRSWTIQSATTVTRNGVVVADVTWGPMFYLHHGLAYCFVAGAAFMFLTYETTNRHYRGQVWSIVGALTIPWLLNVAYLTGLTAFNYTSIGFAAALPVGVLMIFRYRILRLIPVARSSVVEEMDTGYLVLDRGDVVVDVNDRAAELLGIDPERLLGYDRGVLESTFPEVAAAFEGDSGFDTISRQEDGEERYYNVETSALGHGDDGTAPDTGSVVLFQDVTAQIEAQRQLRDQKERLEEQNERLEEFASILSHDLRNPLSVADGRLELARDEHDSVHMEKIAEAHERMDDLISDALALARQGQTVLSREPVSLDRVCRSAWENVDTRSATVEIGTDRTVSADDSQLTQLFENLFRNAVEHGGPGVTVTVGEFDEGFFVADDGPGIPEAKRDAVFEKGFTTSESGTGFGLNIVRTIADAHGWETTVTEAETEGARFEFTGVADAADTGVEVDSVADAT